MKNGLIIDDSGTKRYYLDDELHREDGPAVEYVDGHKEWYIHGEHHCENGPSIEYSNGDKCYHINGMLHRTDGPAMEWISRKEWWLDDVGYEYTEWLERLKKDYPEEYLTYKVLNL